MTWIILLLAGYGLLLCMARGPRGRLCEFTSRPDALPEWRAAFPDAAEPDIVAFLDLVADAFVLRAKGERSLRPTDRIVDIYRAIYPPGHFWVVSDAGELEILAVHLKRKYALAYARWPEDITLYELFHAARTGKLPLANRGLGPPPTPCGGRTRAVTRSQRMVG